MPVLVAGMSAALMGPSLLDLVNHAEAPDSMTISVDRIDGPFEALKIDNGIATGAVLSNATSGMRVAWVLQLSAHALTDFDLDVRLVREHDNVVVAWSRRRLGDLGPDTRTYIVEQPLPADLKSGRYQIVQKGVSNGTVGARWQLPSLSIDVLAGAGH